MDAVGIIVILIVGALIFAVAHRSKTASRSIVGKAIWASVLIIFTLGMLGGAFGAYNDYTWEKEHSTLDSRLKDIKQRYEERGLQDLATTMKANGDYEPEFEQYWKELVDANNKNIERVKQ